MDTVTHLHSMTHNVSEAVHEVKTASLRTSFPWLPESFDLMRHPDGHDDTFEVCRHIERVHRPSLTCNDASYNRREMYRAVQLVRATSQGWRHDVRHPVSQPALRAFPV